MCGIMGCFNPKNLAPENLNSVKQMLAVLHHRGPDSNGIYIDKKTILGHTRLSVVDPAGGIQPMSNENGTIWITFNGEIFNYPELKNQLISKGYHFKTNSDTEVLLRLYEDKKEKCLDYLNGQFAFAIRDNINDVLFLARDHTGILPLFYTNTCQNDFIFASEIKAIFCNNQVVREPDLIALDQIFTFWTTLPGRTFFKNINELPPAHYIKIERGKLLIRKYWEHNFSGSSNELDLNVPELIEKAEDLFYNAIKIRLRADVPVGCYLSGGIDSSGITSLVRNNFNNNLHTFSLLFEEEDFNELKYQVLAIEYFKTKHSYRLITNIEIADNLIKMLYHCEKPMLRTAPVPFFLLSEKVKEEGYKVVLSGEGGDEIFGGYNIFKEAYIRNFWSKRPLSEKRPLLLKKIYPYIFNDPRGYNSLKEFFGYGIDNPGNLLFSHEIRWRNSARIKNFYSQELNQELQGYDPLSNLIQVLPEDFWHWTFFARAQYLELILFLSGYLLCSQGDRAAMANSVELRIPYLDKDLIEFMSKVPITLKLRGLNEKYLLKKILNNKLPKDVLNRPKQPFRAPIKNIFTKNTELTGLFCSKEKLKETGFFDPSKTDMLLKKLRSSGKFSETDNMALSGILTTQAIYFLYIKNFTPLKPEIKIEHFFDYKNQEQGHEVQL